MPGFGGKLPQPRWTVRKGPTIAVSQASGSVLVTYANDPRKRLRVFDLNNPEETNATDVSIWRLDCATGTSESMPTLACPDDSGQCFVLDGILHVNCGASIVMGKYQIKLEHSCPKEESPASKSAGEHG